MLGIVAGGLVPHPPVLIPQIGREMLEEIEETRAAMEEISRRIAAREPEVIVIITPHNPLVKKRINVLTKEKLTGSLAQFGAPQLVYHADNDLSYVNSLRKLEGGEGLFRFAEQGEGQVLDHGILIPLHYLQEAGVDCAVVPACMGMLEREELLRCGELLRSAAESCGRRTVVIASGDLSHRLTADAPAGYNPRGREFDEQLTQALRRMDVEAIAELDPGLVKDAGECGLRPILMMLRAFRSASSLPELFSYEGPFGVGYSVVHIGVDAHIELARRSVEYYAHHGEVMEVPEGVEQELLKKAGVFVSLKIEGQLRGCIGTVEGTTENLAAEIIKNAVQAAFRDPRFPPVSTEELPALEYSVDVLGEPEVVDSVADLDPDKYGVIVRRGNNSGLLLPGLEGINSPEEQVRIAAQKAGIIFDEECVLHRFTVERHSKRD